MLLVSLTGNLGKEGGGLQLDESLVNRTAQFAFMLAGLPADRRITTMVRWDYAHGNMKALTEQVYGKALADSIEASVQKSVQNGWPDYSQVPWRMGIYAGTNAANWRPAGKHWRENAFEQLGTIVSMTPDMGVTSMYADYVLPIAHHYERQDYMLIGQERLTFRSSMRRCRPWANPWMTGKHSIDWPERSASAPQRETSD